jgi:DNA-directed RNA polymerase subunit alpha
MKYQYLSEPVTIKKVEESAYKGVFEIEGLYTGYGLTTGNALRRALLSSLPGTAITQVKIKNVNHEFSTVPGVVENVLDIALNLKKVRLHSYADEPQVLSLKAKGQTDVTAADIETTSEVFVITPDVHIATLSEKSAELDVELTVEKGLGYSPVESRKMEKLPVGTIALDALFSPVLKVTYTVSDMRVGERTDYNKVRQIF